MLPRANPGMSTAEEKAAPVSTLTPAGRAELWSAGKTAENET
jgi:hypothetical protein